MKKDRTSCFRCIQDLIQTHVGNVCMCTYMCQAAEISYDVTRCCYQDVFDQ